MADCEGLFALAWGDSASFRMGWWQARAKRSVGCRACFCTWPVCGCACRICAPVPRLRLGPRVRIRGAEIFAKKADEVAGLHAAVEEGYREAETLRAALAQAAAHIQVLQAQGAGATTHATDAANGWGGKEGDGGDGEGGTNRVDQGAAGSGDGEDDGRGGKADDEEGVEQEGEWAVGRGADGGLDAGEDPTSMLAHHGDADDTSRCVGVGRAVCMYALAPRGDSREESRHTRCSFPHRTTALSMCPLVPPSYEEPFLPRGWVFEM
jgi:hypothetical protein